jgi:hypothetical protein
MALKSNSTFNLKKQFKRILATELDSVRRNFMKRAFIQAQLQSQIKAPKEARADNRNRATEGAAS